MKKQVVVNVSGKHTGADGQNDDIELTTVGTLYTKETGMYLLYDEILGEDEEDVSHNRVKIEEFPTRITIAKSGAVASNLYFEEGNKESSSYATPFGEMNISVDTRRIGLTRNYQDDSMHLEIEYDMEINYDHVTNSLITIHMTPCEGQ